MSTDTSLAGMPTETRKEILWDRNGLPAEFYGPELIAEALFEALKTMDCSTMKGFVPFNQALRKHRFGLDNTIVEGAADVISPPRWFNPSGVNLNLLDLERVWGVGTFDTKYGVIGRCETSIPSGDETECWLAKSEWDDDTRQNDISRVSKPDQMPSWRISHMRAKRVFLSQSGRIVVVDIECEAVKLAPQAYRPKHFRVGKIIFDSRYGANHKESILRFLTDHGLKAGVAVMSGLKLALQSSNYCIREALEPNEKAEKMLDGLLAQVNG